MSSTVGQKEGNLSVHSQKGKTKRWLCSGFSAEHEVRDAQVEGSYHTRPSEGDWSAARKATTMPLWAVAMLPLKSKWMIRTTHLAIHDGLADAVHRTVNATAPRGKEGRRQLQENNCPRL